MAQRVVHTLFFKEDSIQPWKYQLARKMGYKNVCGLEKVTRTD